MRKKTTCILVLLAIAASFSSCSVDHYMYSSSPAQAPMLNSKGEMNITGMLTSGMHMRDTGYNNGYDLQGAYAVSDHIAVTAAYSGRHEKDKYHFDHAGWSGPSYYSQLWYKRSTAELGIGYFTSIDSDDEVFFDIYSGYGFGKYQMHEVGLKSGIPLDLYHTASIGKFYLQPGIHFNASDMSQFSLSLRFTTVGYHNIKSDYTPDQEKDFDMSAIRNTTYAYLDPCFAVRLWIPHSPWIKLETQFSTGIRLTRQFIHYRAANLSLGLSFDLSKLNDHSNYKQKKRRG